MTIEVDPLRARGADVAMLSDSLRRGGTALESVPYQVEEIWRSGSWRLFITKRGKKVEHERFADFVVAPPLGGLGASADLVLRLSKGTAVYEELREALSPGQGRRADLVDNINEVPRPDGTSEGAALRRLRKDRPDLHADVLAERLSAHAAMVEAGFRPRTVTVPVGRPDTVAKTLRKHMTADDLARLAALLTSEV